MKRTTFISPVALALMLGACQAPVSQVPTSTPSAAASVGAPAAATSPHVAVSAGPASPVPVVQLAGKVYDDEGRPLPSATIEAFTADGAYRRSLPAIGGAYALTDVPVGLALTVRASMPGHTVRERVHTASLGRPEDDRDPNILDFGGPAGGGYYALSPYPEIVDVTPANRAAGVGAQPLTIAFRLSHALPVEQQQRFGRLLRVDFQVPSNVDPSGFVSIQAGSTYLNDTAKLTWNAEGTVGTFTFGAPIVTRQAEAAGITIQFDQNAPLDEWPLGDNDKRLGRDYALSTWTGTGTNVSGRVAPFWRGTPNLPVPTDRPSPMTVWGATHATTSSFSLAPDTRRPKVQQVFAAPATGGEPDRLLVVFDEPMRGFPESALDGKVLQQSNYRYTVGRIGQAKDAQAYQESDPAKNGTTPVGTPYYASNRYDTVVLPLPSGVMTQYTHFKLYVDPAVTDLAGNTLQISPQDPTTGLADHVLEGRF